MHIEKKTNSPGSYMAFALKFLKKKQKMHYSICVSGDPPMLMTE